jgi:hypothetical protein
MRSVLALLCLVMLGSTTSGAIAAGPAVGFTVNCIRSAYPPVSTHCFDATLGSPVTAYIVAFDSFGQIATSYAGTVHLTSADPTATLPPDHTFTAADAGIWAAPVTFHSLISSNMPSPQAITATDTTSPAITGMQLWQVYQAPPPASTPSLNAVGIGFMLLLIGGIGAYFILREESRGRHQTNHSLKRTVAEGLR